MSSEPEPLPFGDGEWEYRPGYDQRVYEDGHMVCQLRGWGHLTGYGECGMKLPAAEAVKIQDALGYRIAAVNKLLAGCRKALEYISDEVCDDEALMQAKHEMMEELEAAIAATFPPEVKPDEINTECAE